MANLEKLNNTINELENQSKTLEQFSGVFGKVNDLKDEVNKSSKILKKSGSELNAFVEKASTEIDSTLSQIETRSNDAILSINVLQKENQSQTMELLKTKLNELNAFVEKVNTEIDSTLSQIETRSNEAIFSLNVLHKENHSETMELLKTKLNELYDDNKRYQKDLDGLVSSKIEQNKSDIQTEIRSRIRDLETFTEKRINQLKNDIQGEIQSKFNAQSKKMNLLTRLTLVCLVLVFTSIVLELIQ